jgi:hypothetical protein
MKPVQVSVVWKTAGEFSLNAGVSEELAVQIAALIVVEKQKGLEPPMVGRLKFGPVREQPQFRNTP